MYLSSWSRRNTEVSQTIKGFSLTSSQLKQLIDRWFSPKVSIWICVGQGADKLVIYAQNDCIVYWNEMVKKQLIKNLNQLGVAYELHEVGRFTLSNA
jgi:hypothetical protein